LGRRLSNKRARDPPPPPQDLWHRGPDRPINRDCSRAGTFRSNSTALAPNVPARRHSKAPRGPPVEADSLNFDL
jgi:hypothetical protein